MIQIFIFETNGFKQGKTKSVKNQETSQEIAKYLSLKMESISNEENMANMKYVQKVELQG